MAKKEVGLPKINKRLMSFLLSEEGKISKTSLLKVGVVLGLASTVSVRLVSGGCACCGGGGSPPPNSCGCGCGCGACGCGACGCGCGGCAEIC